MMKIHHMSQEFKIHRFPKALLPLLHSPHLWLCIFWDHWLTQCPYVFLRDLHTPGCILRYIFFIAFHLSDDIFSLEAFYVAYKSASGFMYYLVGKQKKVSKVTGCIFKKEIDATIISLSYKFFGVMVAFFCFSFLPCRKKEGPKIIIQVSEERCLCSLSSQVAVQTPLMRWDLQALQLCFPVP